MTDPAPTAPTVPYASPVIEPASRPASVTFLASVGILFGTLLVLCKPVGLFTQVFMPMPQPNPLVDVIRNDPAIRFFMIAGGITGTLISLLLLMSSLGSLALKPWGRTGMLGYAALAILMTAVNQVFGAAYMGPAMERAMQQSGMPQPMGMGFMKGWVGVAIGLVIGLWYPLLILVYFNRTRAKRAFEEGLPRRDI